VLFSVLYLTIYMFRGRRCTYTYACVFQELVFKSCLSPDGRHLLTLSTESKLCLYQVPSLNLVSSWSLDSQPCSDQMSPSLEHNSKKTKYLKETPYYYHLLDVAWWSDKVVIFCQKNFINSLFLNTK